MAEECLHASTRCPMLLGPPDPYNPCRCSMGDEQAVRLLLELGADPNAGRAHGQRWVPWPPTSQIIAAARLRRCCCSMAPTACFQ
jgi:hypothetical protein